MEMAFALKAKEAIDGALLNDNEVPPVLVDITRAATIMASWMWTKDLSAQVHLHV